MSLSVTKFCLFPQIREEFKHGNVHVEMERRIRHTTGDKASKYAKKIGDQFSTAYHKIWGKYTDTLAERKLNLDGRLRQEYNTTVKKIKKVFTLDYG